MSSIEEILEPKLTLADKQIFYDPTCEKCGGIGMVYSEHGGGYAHCECHKRVRIIRQIDRSGIAPKYRSCRMTNWSGENEAEKTAWAKAVCWIKGFEPGSIGLYIHGPVGTGKTHMLAAIASAIIERRGIQVYYRTTLGLITAIREEIGLDHDHKNAFELAAGATVLCLDDIGADKPTDWTIEQLTGIIDRRYSDGLTTVIASNLSLEAVGNTYGARIADRISGMCQLLGWEGKSRRGRT